MTPDTEGLIRSKIASVGKFLERTDEEEVLVEFEVERSTHHRKGDVFHAEGNLTHRGDLFRAQSNKFDIRVAVDDVRKQLEEQIRRARTKKLSLVKRGARMIKKMLRRK